MHRLPHSSRRGNEGKGGMKNTECVEAPKSSTIDWTQGKICKNERFSFAYSHNSTWINFFAFFIIHHVTVIIYYIVEQRLSKIIHHLCEHWMNFECFEIDYLYSSLAFSSCLHQFHLNLKKKMMMIMRNTFIILNWGMIEDYDAFFHFIWEMNKSKIRFEQQQFSNKNENK